VTVIKLDPDRSTRAVDRRNLDGFTEHPRFCEDYANYQGRSSRPVHQKDRDTGLR
jgi:hypothetical protein